MEYFGQAHQDKFVLNVLKEKRNGYFIEIGSNDAMHINNTYILEKKFSWRGIMIEYEPQFLASYKKYRTNSIHHIGDARDVDYRQLFESNNVPKVIDYLQIDLEVDNGSTLKTLQKIETLFDEYRFAVITFEHDIYHTNFNDTRLVSREIFKKAGYLCVFEDIANYNNPYEDWYVHPDLVDTDYINKLIQNNINNYEPNDVTGKMLNWENINYLYTSGKEYSENKE